MAAICISSSHPATPSPLPWLPFDWWKKIFSSWEKDFKMCCMFDRKTIPTRPFENILIRESNEKSWRKRHLRDSLLLSCHLERCTPGIEVVHCFFHLSPKITQSLLEDMNFCRLIQAVTIPDLVLSIHLYRTNYRTVSVKYILNTYNLIDWRAIIFFWNVRACSLVNA